MGDGEASVAIGSLRVIDDVPREAEEAELGELKDLARIAEALVEARAIASRAVALAEARRWSPLSTSAAASSRPGG